MIFKYQYELRFVTFTWPTPSLHTGLVYTFHCACGYSNFVTGIVS